jgi:hypothetical protein
MKGQGLVFRGADKVGVAKYDFKIGADGRVTGFPLHHVQQMLGHADISTTSTYLNVTRLGLHESMKKLDDARNGLPPTLGEGAACQPEPDGEQRELSHRRPSVN